MSEAAAMFSQLEMLEHQFKETHAHYKELRNPEDIYPSEFMSDTALDYFDSGNSDPDEIRSDAAKMSIAINDALQAVDHYEKTVSELEQERKQLEDVMDDMTDAAGALSDKLEAMGEDVPDFDVVLGRD